MVNIKKGLLISQSSLLLWRFLRIPLAYDMGNSRLPLIWGGNKIQEPFGEAKKYSLGHFSVFRNKHYLLRHRIKQVMNADLSWR